MYKLWYNNVDCSTDRAGCWSCAGLCAGGPSAGTGNKAQARQGVLPEPDRPLLTVLSSVGPWGPMAQHLYKATQPPYKLQCSNTKQYLLTSKMTASLHYMTCTCIDLLYKGAHTIEISFSCTRSTSNHFRSCPVDQAERHRNRRRGVGACSLTVIGKDAKGISND